jgi:uncharacterized membrane protein YhdT
VQILEFSCMYYVLECHIVLSYMCVHFLFVDADCNWLL